jgi:hypothetical protein
MHDFAEEKAYNLRPKVNDIIIIIIIIIIRSVRLGQV